MAKTKTTATAGTTASAAPTAPDGSWDARDAIAPRAAPGQAPGGPPAGITRSEAERVAGTTRVTILDDTMVNGEGVARGTDVDVHADDAQTLFALGKAKRASADAADASGIAPGLPTTLGGAVGPRAMQVAEESAYATATGIASVAPEAVAADPVVDGLQHADPAVSTANDPALRNRAAVAPSPSVDAGTAATPSA